MADDLPPKRTLLAIPALFRRVTAHGRYRPEIDGLRFFAIFFVLLGHLMERTTRALGNLRPLSVVETRESVLIPQAPTGVLLFFAISGYILAVQFLRQRERGQAFGYIKYLKRRASRIAPPYYIILLIGFLAVALGGIQPPLTDGAHARPGSLGVSLLASIVFLHGLIFGALPRNFPPGWSLELEASFYVFAPLLFALMASRLTGAVAAIRPWLVFVASILFMVAGQAVFGDGSRYYFSLVKYLPFFLLGPLMAMRVPAAQTVNARRLADAIGFGGLLGLALGGIGQHFAHTWITVAADDIARLICVGAMFVGALRGSAFIAMCSHRWVSFIGGACFSIYLCHLQVMQVMTLIVLKFLRPNSLAIFYGSNLLVQLPLIFVVSFVFYVLIERPFMNPAIFQGFHKRKPAVGSF